jgi:hypothetical protein
MSKQYINKKTGKVYTQREIANMKRSNSLDHFINVGLIVVIENSDIPTDSIRAIGETLSGGGDFGGGGASGSWDSGLSSDSSGSFSD